MARQIRSSRCQPGSRIQPIVGDQLTVPKTPAVHRLSHRPHLLDGIQIADVVAARELVDVPLEVLGRELVERALVGSFQDRPKRLDAVRVRVCACPLTYSPTECCTDS